MQVLDKHIGVLDQLGENGFSVGSRCIERQRLLVAVELQEVIARAVGVELDFVPGSVARTGTLDLYHIGAEPCKKLCTRRAGLHIGEVDHLDSLKRCCIHSIRIHCVLIILFLSVFPTPGLAKMFTWH